MPALIAEFAPACLPVKGVSSVERDPGPGRPGQAAARLAWSSARAHLAGEDDAIVEVKPVLDRVGGFGAAQRSIGSLFVETLGQKGGKLASTVPAGVLLRWPRRLRGRRRSMWAPPDQWMTKTISPDLSAAPDTGAATPNDGLTLTLAGLVGDRRETSKQGDSPSGQAAQFGDACDQSCCDRRADTWDRREDLMALRQPLVLRWSWPKRTPSSMGLAAELLASAPGWVAIRAAIFGPLFQPICGGGRGQCPTVLALGALNL